MFSGWAGGGGGVLFKERLVWFIGSLSLKLLDFDHFCADYVHFSLELDMVSRGLSVHFISY